MKNKHYLMGLLSCNPDIVDLDNVLLNDLFKIYGIKADVVGYLKEDLKNGDIDSDYILDYLRGVFDIEGSIKDNILGLNKNIIKLYHGAGYDVEKLVGEENKSSGHNLYFLNIVSRLYCGGLFNSQRYEDFINVVRLTPDETMMQAAYLFSRRSACIRKKVGCVITNEQKTNIISIGYNGGVKGSRNCCESSLEGLCGCIHAEENALLKGCGSNLYCTTMPCEKCAKLIINAGVKNVFYAEEYRTNSSLSLFKKSGINCEKIDNKKYGWKLNIGL